MPQASNSGGSHDFIPVKLAPPRVVVETREGGQLLLRSPEGLAPYPRQFGEYLRKWAAASPDRLFLAERVPDGSWRRISYKGAAALVDRISQGLLDRGLGATGPIAAFCDNCINMGLLKLAAMQIGIPFLPVSPAYSLMSQDFSKIRFIVEHFSPSLIYVPSLAPFSRALASVPLSNAVVVTDSFSKELANTLPFAELLARAATDEVNERFDAVDPDTVAKILLTSGSTGMPKGVINTHRMLCSNGVALDQVWPFLAEELPVIVDWLPWNHTFGTNFNLGQIMRHGGAMYIDAGKPAPGRINTTIANLRDVQPTLLYNVPRGFDMLVPALEQDADLARWVFTKLSIIFYAGAALPEHLWHRLDALAIKHRGARIPILSALGSTETSPVATLCHWPADDFGGVGLPVPGTEIKLIPSGQKLEIRVKGANVTPGYYRSPEQTAAAFDEEGYFKLGDAVKLVDSAQPSRGLLFDGRVSENFKLSSGTWVHVGELRLDAISAASPVVQDAVVTGHDRDDAGLLLFLNLDAARKVAGDDAATMTALASNEAIQEFLSDRFREFNRHNPGSSRRIARVMILSEPPSIDGNEITDKGYLNQRALVERRAGDIAVLYSAEPGRTSFIVNDSVTARAPA